MIDKRNKLEILVKVGVSLDDNRSGKDKAEKKVNLKIPKKRKNIRITYKTICPDCERKGLKKILFPKGNKMFYCNRCKKSFLYQGKKKTVKTDKKPYEKRKIEGIDT